MDLILNARARRLRPGSPLRRELVLEAERAGARIHDPSDLEGLDRVAAEIAARADGSAQGGTDAVVIAGGDGSFMRGLSALSRAFGDRALPPVGLASAGTVGTVARNLGLSGAGAAVRVLRSACAVSSRRARDERDATSSGSTSSGSTSSGSTSFAATPTLRVRDDAGRAFVGFIFGAGLVARFFEAYHAKERPGLSAAAQIAARVFVGSFVDSPAAREILSPTPAALTVDGQRAAGDAWSVVVASVVRDMGLHFLVAYRAGGEPGKFHVVASGLPPRALGPQMTRVLLAKPLVGEPRVDALARAMSVEFASPAEGYVVDGDLMHAKRATVETGPVLRLIRGE